MKSYLLWLHMRNWCEVNPNKVAAVVTPFGMFEIKFTPNKKDESEYEVKYFDQLKKYE